MPSRFLLFKLVHTGIFFFLSTCLIYILYAGITRTYNWYLVVAIGAISLEGLVLILNHWQCPLTMLAKKYSNQSGSVTDIFLPFWYARNAFKISTVLFLAELILLGFGYSRG